MNDDIFAHEHNPVIGIFEDCAVSDACFSRDQSICLPFVEELSAGSAMRNNQSGCIILTEFHDSGHCFIEAVLKFFFSFPAVLFELIAVRKRRIEGFIMTFQLTEEPFFQTADSFIGHLSAGDNFQRVRRSFRGG